MLLIFLLMYSLSVPSNESPTCGKTLMDSCIREEFARAVAHGIHSLHLKELQYFFDASASEDNTIPVINFDLSSSDLVLPSVPDLKLNNTFLTPSLMSVDHILSNWENTNFFMKDATVLEMLVHNLHMYETLSVAGKIYKKLKKKVKKNDNNLLKRKIRKVCKCMKEEDAELLTILENMARSMRNSGALNSDARVKKGKKDYCDDWRDGEYSSSRCDFGCKRCYHKKGKRFIKNCSSLVKNLAPSSINHHGHGNFTAVPLLVDSATWKVWKSQLDIPDAQQWNYELATYIYCKIKM